MKYKILRLLLLLSFTLSLTTQAQNKTDEELAEIVRLAMEKRNKVKYKDKEAIKIFRTALKDLSDAEKIRGFYQIVLYRDKVAKYPMSSDVAYDEYWAFSQDPHLITDYSALKRLIREEQDPRKFFLLSCMRPRTTKENNHNFIPGLAHMLFEDGRVIRYEGESTFPFNHDVSILAYQLIESSLKAYGVVFKAPNGLTHDQEVVVLAKWLKKNWKGCENLVIPEKFLQLPLPKSESTVKATPDILNAEKPSKMKPQDNDEIENKQDEVSSLEKPNSEATTTQSPDEESSYPIWLIVACSIITLSLLGLILKRRS